MKDLTGETFGRLFVLRQNGRDKDGCVLWLCRCTCGKDVTVSSNKLRTGHTKSCGCLLSDMLRERNKRVTTFDMSGEFGIGYTTNTGKEFWFDKEDFDLLQGYAWFENDQGYVCSYIGGRIVRLHRLVFPCHANEIIDHKNRNRQDNRKSNLRIATKQLNGINRGPSKNNRVGIKGVSKMGEGGKYVARICKNGSTINIGTFDTPNEAESARVAKEIELFGEFAFSDGGD